MSDEIFEYYFLSDCYDKGVDEFTIYKAFIEKVLTDYGNKINTTISKLQGHLLRKYSLEVPPTLIRDVILALAREYPGVVFAKETLKIDIIPKEMEDKARSKQLQSDEDSRTVFASFNTYLLDNKSDTISYHEFISYLKEYKKRLFKSEYVIPASEKEKLFVEWVAYTFNITKATKITEALNKIMYSWLVYYYFHAIKRASKKLNQFVIHLDTNVLAYYFGINGEERKNYVLYLLQKIKENNCTIVVSSVTNKEFHDLVNAAPNNEIRIYKASNVQTANQILYNTAEAVKAEFKKIGQEVVIKPEDLGTIKGSTKYWNELFLKLKNYKQSRVRHDLTEFSIDHDINIIHSIDAYKKINNIYEERRIAVTCDSLFAAWFAQELESKYSTYFSNILTLEKVNLIFWVESDKCNSNDFLANTWLYVTESINYFKNSKVNVLFRAVQEEIIKNTVVASNWRSIYVLIKNNLGDGVNAENAKEEDFFSALSYVRDSSINEVDILKATAKTRVEIENEIRRELALEKERSKELELQLVKEKQEKLEKKVELVEKAEVIRIGEEYNKSPIMFILKRIGAFIKKIFECFK